jgi:hypothetical protein
MSASEPSAATELSREFIARILRPYKPHCRYVLAARVTGAQAAPASAAPVATRSRSDGSVLCTIESELAIPESCYIDDTGHLNTVEVNICYNQMLYLLLAQGIAQRLIPALDDMDLAHFERRYLPDVLIHRIQGSFKRVIDRRSFTGRMSFTSALRAKKFSLIECRARFVDAHDGLANFDVDVAFVRGA